jgi:hypothetical protein
MVVNLANGSTIAGLGVALAGGAKPSRGADGLLTASGYRPPLPPAAFTLGNVIIVNRRRPGLLSPGILAHEARHATQYAWCGGLVMLPLYFAAAGVSWALCGDVGAWNVFERQAGLADGGYLDRPLRPALTRALSALSGRPPSPAGTSPGPLLSTPSGQPAQAAGSGLSAAGPEPAGHAGSTASPSQ